MPMADAAGLTTGLGFREAFMTNGEAAETVARPGSPENAATQQNRIAHEMRAIVDSP
jgi:hypothetical protein